MDELMKALECCAEYACGECPYQKYSSTDYYMKCSHKIIADLAAADLKPERHGRWVEKPNPWGQDGSHSYDCSICRKRTCVLGEKLHYCPNCGAKMDLEEEV